MIDITVSPFVDNSPSVPTLSRRRKSSERAEQARQAKQASGQKLMLRRTSSSAPHFDVKLQNNAGRDQRIILVKGSSVDASYVTFNGEILLSATDNMSIKKIKLMLVGELKLRWSDDVSKTKASGHQPSVKFEKKVWKQELSNFELPEKLSRSNPGSRLASPAGSLTNLSSYFQSGSHNQSQRLLSPNAARTNLTRSSNSLTSLTSHFSPLHNNHRQKSRSDLPSISHGNSRAASPEPDGRVSDAQGEERSRSPGGSASPIGRSRSPSVQPRLENGNYTFPFEMVIPGDIPESIEGNPYVSLTYFVHATAERGGLRGNVSAKKHVRVIRTIGADTYDFAHTVSIENQWPGKVDYKIFIPSKAVPMGSKLDVQFNLIPLNKGLRLGKIRTEIVEYVTLHGPASLFQHQEERVVMKQVFFPPSKYTNDASMDQWEFSQGVDVPASLSRLTQDVIMEPHVRISHKLKMSLALINRDGHTSELRASLPIHVFISPRVPVNAIEPEMHNNSEQSIFDAPSFSPDTTEAPPLYSERLYDRLYSEVATPVESPGSPVFSVPGTM